MKSIRERIETTRGLLKRIEGIWENTKIKDLPEGELTETIIGALTLIFGADKVLRDALGQLLVEEDEGAYSEQYDEGDQT